MNEQDAGLIQEALSKPETLVLSPEEKALKDFFSPYFYEVAHECKGPDSLLYSDKLGVKDVENTPAKYLWSAKEVDPETRSAVKAGVILIEGLDIKQEYIMRFLRNCSI